MDIKIKSQSGYSDFYINQLKMHDCLVLNKGYITQITGFGTFLLPGLAPFYYRSWHLFTIDVGKIVPWIGCLKCC